MDKLEKMLQTTPILARIIESTLNVRLDFSPESLCRIEKAINRVYPQGHSPVQTTIIAYGIYLGEVFVQNNPDASWGPYDEDIMELHFKITKGEKAFIGYPLKRVQNFWFDREQGLYIYYQMNMDLIEGKIVPELGDEWKDYNGQYQYRFPMSIRSSKA